MNGPPRYHKPSFSCIFLELFQIRSFHSIHTASKRQQFNGGEAFFSCKRVRAKCSSSAAQCNRSIVSTGCRRHQHKFDMATKSVYLPLRSSKPGIDRDVGTTILRRMRTWPKCSFVVGRSPRFVLLWMKTDTVVSLHGPCPIVYIKQRWYQVVVYAFIKLVLYGNYLSFSQYRSRGQKGIVRK